MKTRVIFAISMLIAVFAFGQEQKVEEVEVTAPQYAGIKNPAAMQGVYPNTLIKEYLSQNIVYPEEALTCNIEGTEVVKFTVTIEGNVKDFKIVNSVCPEIDKEVILTLELTNGMWYPGNQKRKTCGNGNRDTIYILFFYHQLNVSSRNLYRKSSKLFL